MFCEKCGNKLPELADFCPQCGNKIYNNHVKARNNKEILLEVRPTYKFAYIVLPKLLKELMFSFPFIFLVSIMVYIGNAVNDSLDFGDYYFIMSARKAIILIFIAFPLFRILWIIGKTFFEKKQYQNYVYIFYSDRVVFRDSFIDVSEKELKYINIKEITKRQTFIQRYFNIGNIVLFSNAEGGFFNGVFMLHIEDVDDIYKKVKEIINI